MTGDLGSYDAQVEAGRVLDFWFGLTKEQHFAKDEALDREIAARFGPLRDVVLADGAVGWRDRPDTLLAAIILLDQFSRNLHRGSPAAFEADELAVTLTLHAIEQGWEGRYAPDCRVFIYLPLMHAEDLGLQQLSVEKYEALGLEENAAFARAHRDAIVQFGRFPGRNAALGRDTTPEEQVWLEANHGGW
jgi:uncharacterized protein (DUF924 family)